MHYKIILDEPKLDEFINILPETSDTEVFYISLFARHKYHPSFPNTRDQGQLARIISKKQDIKEKIRRFETPIGSYTRDGSIVVQEAIAVYIGLNPRSLVKANKNILVELAKRFAEGNTVFNPIQLATTEIHRATDKKYFVDFDFDDVEFDSSVVENIIPKDSYKILKTRGGFHLIVELAKIKGIKSNWYTAIASLPNCDIKGTSNLTPIPGCTQGGFIPYFI